MLGKAFSRSMGAKFSREHPVQNRTETCASGEEWQPIAWAPHQPIAWLVLVNVVHIKRIEKILPRRDDQEVWSVDAL